MNAIVVVVIVGAIEIMVRRGGRRMLVPVVPRALATAMMEFFPVMTALF